VSWDIPTVARMNANQLLGVEVPLETVLVRDPVRAHAETTIEHAAAILAVSVLEARALSIAFAQSPGARRTARTGATARITDMIAVEKTMIISAQSLREMARPCTLGGAGAGGIIRWLSEATRVMQ
jgi:hypothetical protein